MKFCQSCGMPLTEDVLGTNADGSKNEDYCMYCYRDGKFLQDCTMDEMIEHCAQFFAEQSGKAERVGAVNEGLEKPITKEEYIGMMKTYFPQLKRWRKTLNVSSDEVMTVNPASGRVMEKCGFVPTGETCIDANQYQGENRPIRVLRLEIRNKE